MLFLSYGFEDEEITEDINCQVNFSRPSFSLVERFQILTCI